MSYCVQKCSECYHARRAPLNFFNNNLDQKKLFELYYVASEKLPVSISHSLNTRQQFEILMRPYNEEKLKNSAVNIPPLCGLFDLRFR